MASIARKFNIYDMPDSRKNHKSPTPLLGGIAICISTLATILLFAQPSEEYILLALIVGAVGVTVMGLIDDIINLSAVRRLIILVCIAVIIYFSCIMFYFTDKQVNASTIEKVIFFIYIICWIVGVANAINFADGLDGLASYLSLISCIAFSIIFCLQGRDSFISTITLSLCGGIAGFIPYNRNPALIFMGDAGSMFIGFMLGILSVAAVIPEDNLLSLIVPIYILLVPILDMCLSVIRRLITKKSPIKPDNMHIHHMLNERFKNQIMVVLILSLIQIAFAAAGIFIFITKIYLIACIIIGAILLVCILVLVITIKNKKQKLNMEAIGKENSKQISL
jgi:UDP-GlcNAc:undecaprenyl-phosphate/decaprenyl-phosphate GlcNAc-1-phosphate transferase